MQRLVYEAGLRAASRSDLQAQAGLALAREIKANGGKFLAESALASDLLAATTDMSSEYLSHEYMSAHWAPAFHADVAAAMAEAKLDWVSSANPLENFPELNLTPEQRAVMDRYKDPIMRELVKDTCLPRQFRHDVFVRGARRLSNAERDAALTRLTVVPLVTADELQTKIRVPAGMAEVGEPLKNMMTAAMRGPTTIGDLLALEQGRSNPAELVSMLVGTSQCQIAMRPDGVQPECANRLNRVLGARVSTIAHPKATGREDDAEAWVKALSADVVPEKHDTVRKVVHEAIKQRVPILRQLQIVPD